MATKLDKDLKREIEVGGRPYVVTLSPEGFKIVEKGKRKGLDFTWESLLSGDAALATALNATLAQTAAKAPAAAPAKKPRLRAVK